MNMFLIVIIIIILSIFLLYTIGSYIELSKFEKENFNLYKSDFIDKMKTEEEKLFRKKETKIKNQIEELKKECAKEEQAAAVKKDMIKESLELAKKNNREQIQKLQEELVQKVDEQSKQNAAELQSINEYYSNQQFLLQNNFENFKVEIEEKKEILLKELKKEEKRQQEIIEQRKRDEENKKKKDFYRIVINDIEKSDIKKLKELSFTLSKPEILLKLIYETYYKTKLEELFKRVLGENKNSTGIYKITNIENNKIYIGKTTKFIDRWRTHAKRGCGIERISGLLYDAMFEEGLENFTWEVVSVCNKDELSEKEKEMIEFYKSNEYGYNIRKG